MKELAEAIVVLFKSLTSFSKIWTFIIVAFTLFWVDTQMGFTYHYFTERKITEIERYNKILDDSTLDDGARNLLRNERTAIITKNRALLEPIKKARPDHSFVFFLSISWLYILMALFSYPLLKKTNPYDSDKEIRSQSIWIGVFAVIGIMFVYFIANGISRYVRGAPLYVLNSFIQIALFVIAYKLSVNSQTRIKGEV